MNTRASFDSNVLIRCLRGDTGLQARLLDYSERSITVFVLGELIFGAKASAAPMQRVREVVEFSQAFDLVTPNERTAEVYADLRMNLRRVGRPIPSNDCWIAALCLQFGMALATQDAHFQHIAGLNVIHV